MIKLRYRKDDSMSYEIKKMTYEDIDMLIDLNIKCFRETYDGILSNKYLDDLNLNKEKIIKEEQNYFNQDDDLVYLLVCDNKCVGYMAIGKSKIDRYLNYGEIKSLYVLKEYQGKGYGSLLFNFAVSNLKKMGYQNICLGCLKANIKANMFYNHLGCKLIDCHETITGNTKMLENIYIVGG